MDTYVSQETQIPLGLRDERSEEYLYLDVAELGLLSVAAVSEGRYRAAVTCVI